MTGAPLFILSCARSGSTLLRLAMDAHPRIACPPELHLLQLGQRLLWTQRLTLGRDDEGSWDAAIAASRKVIDDIMGACASRNRAAYWCEKSITSVNHLDILRGLFPDARCLVLVRHAADVVASGLAAIADRPEGYDFEPYLAADPLRPQALLRYWLDKTRALAEFAADPATRTVTVCYEEFVAAPDAVLAAIATGLDLPPCPDWAQRIYQMAHQRGPGDGTVYQRSEVSPASVGRGVGLAWDGVSRNLVRRVDRTLDELGYPPLESAARERREGVPCAG